MKKTFLTLFAALALIGPASVFAGASSCVDCHGNVDTMKLLVPKPAEVSSEGEG
jgi:hypothetical protein